MTIYRGDGNIVEIHSWKVRREGVIGSRGKLAFRFNSQTARYALDEAVELL